MQFNRSISFTFSWKHTFTIAFILAGFVSAILILLQPFDTYQFSSTLKTLKLLGYSVCIVLPVLFLHIPERKLFLKSQKKWTLAHEILIMGLGFFLISALAYLYNSLVINKIGISWIVFMDWALSFGLPFAPVFLPLWAYLRYRFSSIAIVENRKDDSSIVIKGSNNDEELEFRWTSFIMAHSQSNYVEIFLHPEKVEKHIIRSTLSSLVNQLPAAMQIHRSYIVNADYIESLNGNSRKGSAVLKGIKDEVPISPKHFKALKESLHFRP